MKKLFAILTALCLMCTCCAVLADTEPPTWESMPAVVIEDENTVVEESAFAGEWVLNAAFFGGKYVDLDALMHTYDYDISSMPFCIGEGKVTREEQQENGEFVTREAPYTFEAGQLHGTDWNGRNFVFELLEDGNIVLSLFYPGEGEEVGCLSVFLQHPSVF